MDKTAIYNVGEINEIQNLNRVDGIYWNPDHWDLYRKEQIYNNRNLCKGGSFYYTANYALLATSDEAREWLFVNGYVSEVHTGFYQSQRY